MGADRRMVLVDPNGAAANATAAEARVAAAFAGREVIVSARAAGEPRALGGRSTDAPAIRRSWSERRRWADGASLVLAEAFGVEAARRAALENDVIACITRPGCSVLMVAIDGEPAAVARRATTADGSYLSSIATRPAFRRQGLGALATMLAVRDAVDAGSDLVHLAVEVGNDDAVQLYERLGFGVVGDPAPDLLLH
jgi:[ribosomal protein S18]-alanine N-acetyltransferase